MFDEPTLALIASSLRSGDYSLLLGSGTSLDSKNFAGTKLFSAEDLRQHLCQITDARPTSPLQRVYSNLSRAQKQTEIIDRFRDCEAGPTLRKLPSFVWKRIFTFNIDDVIENVYSRSGSLQSVFPVHYEEDFVEDRDKANLRAIHLHGWVGSPNRGFVFSTSEYVRNIKNISHWMVLLTQFIATQPFIIAGTSLDEVDLEYYLAHRSKITARDDVGPSILVEPSPDSVTKRDCEKYGLQLFHGTMEEFLNYLDQKVPARVSPADLTPAATRRLFPNGTSSSLIATFSADFDRVPSVVEKSNNATKFLYGHAIGWGEIEGRFDVARPNTAAIGREVELRLNDKSLRDRVIVISDETGAGKTTVLRRLAYELSSKGITTLLCSALSQIDARRIAEAIDLIDGSVLLVIDNFADQAVAIADVLSELAKDDVVVLCAEREYRWSYISRALSGRRYKRLGGLQLDQLQSERLVGLYAKFGLVGHPEALKDPAAFSKKIAGDPIAFAACRILNDFHPVDHIVASIWSAANERDRTRYAIAALAQHCFRGGVRYEVLTASAGREAWDEQFEIQHPLPLSYVEGGGRSFVAPLNATLGSRVLDHISKTDTSFLLQCFIHLGNTIAPRVNRNAIRTRSPEARLAGRLFDFDQIVSGFLRDYSSKFYSESQPAWQWNSRYWEQVALLCLSRYQLNPSSSGGQEFLREAVQHARHAVSIETHPLSLTTLGKILISQIGSPGVSSHATYDEAFLRLTDAIEREREWKRMSVHAFVTLFHGTKLFIEIGGRLSGDQSEKIRNLIREAEKKFAGDTEVLASIAEIADQFF